MSDLTLSPSDITFSNDQPMQFETITIYATVFNIGDANASDIVVRFYDIYGNFTNEIGDTLISSIETNSSQQTHIEMLMGLPGIHEIKVCVDPDDTITELNETNNCASRDLIEQRFYITCEDNAHTVPPGQSTEYLITIKDNQWDYCIHNFSLEINLPIFFSEWNATLSVQHFDSGGGLTTNVTLIVEVPETTMGGPSAGLTAPICVEATMGCPGELYNETHSVCTYTTASEESEQPPIADAGPDQTVNEGDVVQLDGSASTAGVGKWDIQIVDSVGDVGFQPSITLDTNGFAHISYLDHTNYDLKYAKWTGSKWDIQIVDSNGSVGASSSMALDTNEYPHISYHDWKNGLLKYAYWNGSKWNIQAVDVTGTHGVDTSLALDSKDRPHISYISVNTHHDVKYAKWNGSGWEISKISGGLLSSLALDKNDYAHIAFSSISGLKYAKWTGTHWNFQKVDAWYGNLWPSLALDNSGFGHISYFNRTSMLTTELRYAQWNGSEWSIQVLDSIGQTEWGTSIALDSKAYPHIAYHVKIPDHDLRYAEWDGISWNIEIVDGPDYIGWFPSIAIDNNDYAHIGYKDYTNGDLKYARVTGGVESEIVKYEWDFTSDGTYDYQETPDNAPDGVFDGKTTHIYGDDGFYTVTLRVTNENGANDTDTCNITVLNVPPIPEWTSRSVDGTILNPPYPEGKEVLFEATVYDPGIHDTFTYDWDFGDGTVLLDAGPSIIHAYGDNNTYVVVLTVTDDDGGVGTDDTPPLVTTNEDPVASIDLPRCPFFEGRLGCPIYGYFTDPGWLDTHSAEWNFGDGEYETAVITEENDPPNATGMNNTAHIYGDNGVYNITFTVVDDDGGVDTAWAVPYVLNLPPSLTVDTPSNVKEGESFLLKITATDPGSDDLFITVDWGDGTSESETYYNNGIGPDPPNSGPGVYPFTIYSNFSHVYGDNGNFTIIVEVKDDDGGITLNETIIIVENVPPTIEYFDYFFNASFAFRIAGEKWHNVEVHLFEDGTEIGYANITRHPGSPDDQMAHLANLSIDFSKVYSAIAYYTPKDDPVNGQIMGATPAWVIMLFEDGSEERIHHTFNVRHEETWIWEIEDFSPYFLGHNITFLATAYDPGSDDLIFTWDWGDGTSTEHIYYNDGASPDPYPSPDMNPIRVTDRAMHSYASTGTYTIALTVMDDDGGWQIIQMTLDIR